MILILWTVNARLKVNGQATHIQNSKTLIDAYKQQQNTTAMPRVYKKKGEKNLWSDEQLYAARDFTIYCDIDSPR